MHKQKTAHNISSKVGLEPQKQGDDVPTLFQHSKSTKRGKTNMHTKQSQDEVKSQI